jgi:restriction system protein
MNTSAEKISSVVQAPLYPLYSDVAHAIRLLDGEPVQRVRDMISAITAQMGTPQNPVDWSDPDTWIGERLSGEAQALARKIWDGSNKALNPRYLNGCYLFINRLRLLDRDTAGKYRIGTRGRSFLAKDETIFRELDAAEGIPKLLSLVAERSPCKRGDILPAWSDYLKAVSQFSTPKTFADTLRRRLLGIAERGLISRDGNFYAITDAGLQWLKGFAALPEAAAAATPSSKRTTVAEAAHAHNEEQQAAFTARLMKLEPVQFEHFVKELLDAMDYEDVRVTKVSGDKGVDVIARVQFGITEITEVVQVKRTEATITRPKVDELRGALPYFKAIRGTIISLGSFAKGAQEGALFVGAAPITLIDGKRLVDLCIKHQVGVRRRPVEIYEIDEAFFAEKFTREEVEELAPITDEEAE